MKKMCIWLALALVSVCAQAQAPMILDGKPFDSIALKANIITLEITSLPFRSKSIAFCDYGQVIKSPEGRSIKQQDGQPYLFNSEVDCLNRFLAYGYTIKFVLRLKEHNSRDSEYLLERK